MRKSLFTFLTIFMFITGCSSDSVNSTNSADKVDSKDSLSSDAEKDLKLIDGNWKMFVPYFEESFSELDDEMNMEEMKEYLEKRSEIEKHFNLNITKDGYAIIEYQDGEIENFSNLSKSEKIKNNAYNTVYKYKIDEEEINLKDTYENNTILYDNISTDGSWSWDYDYPLSLVTNKNKTNFFTFNLESIVIDSYYSDPEKKSRTFDLESEVVQEQIKNGNIKVIEHNNHLKIEFNPPKDDYPKFIQNARTLALLQINDDVMVVNQFVGDYAGSSSMVIVNKQGTNVKKFSENKQTDSKKNLLKKITSSEIDRGTANILT